MFIRLCRKEIIPSTMIIAIILCANPGWAKEYIVKLKYDVNDFDLRSFNTAADPTYKITDVEYNLNLVKVDLSDGESDRDAIADLTKYLDAEYVVENVKLHAFYSPNDPRYGDQWSLSKVQAAAAWDISLGNEAVTVAVIDTGVASHEDLRENFWINDGEIAGNQIDDDNNGFVDDVNGWDFFGNDKDPNDETGAQNPGHGTHCAGIIGATCGNSLGVCGISPKLSLMALRFLGSDGSGDLFNAVKAIEYAANNGAHIISASWGATIPQQGAQPIIDAIQKAEEKGVIFVAAAGNEGSSNDTRSVYPANAQTPNMISVAASNNSDQKPSWSNFGRKVDIASPGENILSTIPGDYKELSGTSMATPLVAGLVALMKSIDISLTGAVARSILQSTGDNVTIDTASKKRVNANAALEAVRDHKLTVVPATLTLPLTQTHTVAAWGGTPPYRFQSLQPAIATITEEGVLTAVSEGDVTIEVIDSTGAKASSVSFKIGTPPSSGGSPCPLPNEMLCAILCAVNPEFPWCSDSPGLPGLPGLPELPFPVPGQP